MNDYDIYELDEEIIDKDNLIYEKIILLSVFRTNSWIKIKHNIKNIKTIIDLYVFSEDKYNNGKAYITETALGIKIEIADYIYIIVRYNKE